ncbi:MAG: NADH-quinone oxidoreductase subunit NuoB [Candidatus Melainabacteria bacterium]|nr:NADH-quinone oxidoreductase subunit NuoB [Candidatus Melainabacteria bacterium]
MFDLLKIWITKGNTVEREPEFKKLDVDILKKDLSRINQLDHKTRCVLSRSLLVRHLDTGSCNAEEAELIALSNPIYDISRFGIEFTASPRHADVLIVTGPVTRHLKIAMERTYKATPNPKIVVAIGDGACNGSIYETTYACLGRVDQFIPVDLYIPGDPPTPEQILKGLLVCKVLLAQKEVT